MLLTGSGMISAVRSFTRMPCPRLLSVTPSSSLVDCKVIIQATGLEAHSPVTIGSISQTATNRETVRFEGHAHYIADNGGVVSVPDQMSLGGTYTGTEPMGLFWSMQPAPGQRRGVRFLLKDVTKPMIVNLSLYQGHLDANSLQTAKPEATTTVERWYFCEDVERIEVHSGRLRGTLFKPKGQGQFPGVIDMFGTVAETVEIRAAMLASYGLACYSLPYFSFGELPPHRWKIELEYFKEAVDWLCDQPFVKPGGIGMVGTCVGAKISLALVTHFSEKVNAVVSINGIHAQTGFPMTLKKKMGPFIPINLATIRPSTRSQGVMDISSIFKGAYRAKDEDGVIFQLENVPNCQFLFIVGEDDRQWDSSYFAREAIRRLKLHGCHNYQLLSYPDAGHMIEVPYAPASINLFTPAAVLDTTGIVVDYGGSAAGNAKAMEDSWPKIIRFLHTYCGRDNSTVRQEN